MRYRPRLVPADATQPAGKKQQADGTSDDAHESNLDTIANLIAKRAERSTRGWRLADGPARQAA